MLRILTSIIFIRIYCIYIQRLKAIIGPPCGTSRARKSSIFVSLLNHVGRNSTASLSFPVNDVGTDSNASPSLSVNDVGTDRNMETVLSVNDIGTVSTAFLSLLVKI